MSRINRVTTKRAVWSGKRISAHAAAMAEDEVALGRLFTVARKLAEQEGIAEDGYRLVVNCNRHGGQEVYHLHMHLLGGKLLGGLLAE